MLGKAAGAFGINVQEPQWVQLKRPNDYIPAIESDVDPERT